MAKLHEFSEFKELIRCLHLGEEWALLKWKSITCEYILQLARLLADLGFDCEATDIFQVSHFIHPEIFDSDNVESNCENILQLSSAYENIIHLGPSSKKTDRLQAFVSSLPSLKSKWSVLQIAPVTNVSESAHSISNHLINEISQIYHDKNLGAHVNTMQNSKSIALTCLLLQLFKTKHYKVCEWDRDTLDQGSSDTAGYIQYTCSRISG